MSSDSESAPFTTFDSSLATYLVHCGHRAHAVFDPAERQVMFSFRATPEVEANRRAYFEGALVPAMAYPRASRIAYAMVRDARRAYERQQDGRQ